MLSDATEWIFGRGPKPCARMADVAGKKGLKSSRKRPRSPTVPVASSISAFASLVADELTRAPVEPERQFVREKWPALLPFEQGQWAVIAFKHSLERELRGRVPPFDLNREIEPADSVRLSLAERARSIADAALWLAASLEADDRKLDFYRRPGTSRDPGGPSSSNIIDFIFEEAKDRDDCERLLQVARSVHVGRRLSVTKIDRWVTTSETVLRSRPPSDVDLAISRILFAARAYRLFSEDSPPQYNKVSSGDDENYNKSLLWRQHGWSGVCINIADRLNVRNPESRLARMKPGQRKAELLHSVAVVSLYQLHQQIVAVVQSDDARAALGTAIEAFSVAKGKRGDRTHAAVRNFLKAAGLPVPESDNALKQAISRARRLA